MGRCYEPLHFPPRLYCTFHSFTAGAWHRQRVRLLVAEQRGAWRIRRSWRCCWSRFKGLVSCFWGSPSPLGDADHGLCRIHIDVLMSDTDVLFARRYGMLRRSLGHCERLTPRHFLAGAMG